MFSVLVDLDDIQWNEVATSTARNFNIVDPYTSKNSKYQQMFFEKEAAKKNTTFSYFYRAIIS